MERSQPKQDWKELHTFSQLPGEFDRPRVDCSDFRCSVAHSGYQHWTKIRLEDQFVACPLRGVRQRLQ
jgi:hypothetical protein